MELRTLEKVLQRADELGQLAAITDITIAARCLYTGIAGAPYGTILDTEEFDMERDGAQVLDSFLLLYAPLHALGPAESAVTQ